MLPCGLRAAFARQRVVYGKRAPAPHSRRVERAILRRELRGDATRRRRDDGACYMSALDCIPPNDLEAEAAVLGAMMTDRSMIELVAAIAQPADFYALIHEVIYGVILGLHESGKPVDKISVAEALRTRGELEKFGGLTYLSSFLDAVPTAASANYYASLVAEKARLRRVVVAASRIREIGLSGEADVDAACSDADRVLREALESGARPSGGVSMPQAMTQAYNDLSDAATGITIEKAITMPWPSVNNRLGGFFPEEMVVIAAAPAMGKTAFVLTLADWIAATHGTVAFFTLEMSPDAIARRWLALHSELTARNQRLGVVRSDQWGRVGDSISTISGRPVRLYGRKDGTIEAMRRELSSLQREVGRVRAVVVDHVGFVGDADPRNTRATEHERLDRTYRRLLDIASEFRTTIFAVQHVSRAGMGSRPTLKDIRGGGNAEGHAHSCLMPYRDDPNSEDRGQREIGEIIIAKSRDGEQGTVPMRFIGHRHLWIEQGQSLWF